MQPLLLTLALLAALAQPGAPAPRAAPDQPARLEADGIAAVAAGDLDVAEAAFTAQAEARPDSFTPWYNLAAVASLRGDLPAAERHMTRALALGFSDVRLLRTDPHLKAFRTTDLFRDLDTRWPEVLEARRQADLATARQLVGRAHEARTLDRWKIELLSAHDPTATDQAAAELDRIAAWVTANLFTDLRAENAFADDPWTVVVLPDRTNYAKWTLATFGPDAARGISAIGGAYDHDRRRLVAQDLGATLRHELVHVFHWRDMSRRNQLHAAWIQEGLASLVEDYDLNADALTPVPSWRTNIVKRLHNARRHTPVAELAELSLERMTSSRPLARYAESRAVMLFLLDRARLTGFYRRYAEAFADDPSGLTALREALDTDDQGAVERAFHAWVNALPMVAETGSDLPATLGVEIDNGDGTGVRVTGLPGGGGARRRTGLSVGSFITAVNNRPTRDLNELIRVLSDYAPGDTVTLSHRRGRVHHTSEVTLQPRE